MFWHWELIACILTIVLMVFIEATSQKTDKGKKIKWVKERFNLLLTFLLLGLAICFTATVLLTDAFAKNAKDVPVPVILQLLQFLSWDGKSIQIALLTTSMAYFIPVITEHYWFFIHELFGFRDFWDLYENGVPTWFSNRIISGISIIIAFFILRAQLPEEERLFNFQFFKRKLAYLKLVDKNLK